MRPISTRSVKALRQTDEHWQIVTHQLRIWIAPPDQPRHRPYLILIFNLDDGMIMGTELMSELPTAEDVRAILFKAMARPPREAGPARRPRSVGIPEPGWGKSLAPSLAEIGVSPIDQLPPDEVRALVVDLEKHMRGGEELPGLLSVRGATPELIRGLFAAAAEFYRAAPWIQLTNVQIIAVRHPAEEKPRYVSVMGNGGVEYGLAVYLKWADVERFFNAADDPREAMADTGAHSLLFDEITLLPIDDFEALEHYNWEVADDHAYPLPVVFDPLKGAARRPSLIDLRWYEAALRAIPIFVRDFLKPDGQGDYAPVETAIEIAAQAGPLTAELTYPAGTLRHELRPAQKIEWNDSGDREDNDSGEAVPFFDRRGMEGVMFQAVAREFGVQPGSGDAQLNKAQAIMYQAWDETNPGKRITLAHQALAISPDCADAYVLLAEEQADTLARALEYYQQGMAAGQRALGATYFAENAGHFWGLLETRPYMRASEGVANTLWDLTRRSEAADAYFEMLRLNPNDNQGVRYSLVDLLLEADRVDDLIRLLKQYKDDYSTVWLYTRALLAFREGGASAKANKALKKALEQNLHVPDYLTGKKRIPNRLPDYAGLGDDREAVHYAASHLNYWRRVPGAIDWLKQPLTASPRPRSAEKGKSKPRG